MREDNQTFGLSRQGEDALQSSGHVRARLSIAHLRDAQSHEPEKWPRLTRAYLRLAAADCLRKAATQCLISASE